MSDMGKNSKQEKKVARGPVESFLSESQFVSRLPSYQSEEGKKLSQFSEMHTGNMYPY